MTVRLSAPDVRALLLDIEGTTTPVDFVYQVLFPFARTHAADYVAREGASPACRAALDRLRDELAADRARGEQPPSELLDYAGWLMDRDRKSPGLKALQGLVWEEGYRSGELRGVVYPDVPPALARWRAERLGIYIYSSGSVLAQRLIFGATQAGDLTGCLSGYFDTAVGPKTAPESYRRIAEDIGVAPASIVFVSDAVGELDAAAAAGLRTALCVRSGDTSGPGGHPVVRSFDDMTG